MSAQGRSPVKVCFIDEQGRRTGLFNSSIAVEIPGSEYIEDQELVKIRSPSGDYTIELLGTANGTYSLEVVNVALDYKNMYLPIGTIRENQTRRYKIRVFEDGSIDVFNCAADIDGDDWISLYDAVTLLVAYGSKPGDKNWNEAADIAPPIDIVNLYDAVLLLVNYGKKYS